MPVEYLKETPSQTAGPFVHIGLLPAAAGLATRSQERLNIIAGVGDRIRLEGVVYDGAGTPVRDAVIELWQVDAAGDHRWGRTGCDGATGLWGFETVKPGVVASVAGATQAPHATLLIFARGINIHLQTRCYFDDETAANAGDPTLKAVAEPALQRTLIARRDSRDSRDGHAVYRFDIRLQGDDETVFFDV